MPPFYHLNNFCGKLPCRSQRGSRIAWPCSISVLDFWVSANLILVLLSFAHLPDISSFFFGSINLSKIWILVFGKCHSGSFLPWSILPPYMYAQFLCCFWSQSPATQKLSYGTSISNSSLPSILMPFPMFGSFPWHILTKSPVTVTYC